jgi:hypothetical protein
VLGIIGILLTLNVHKKIKDSADENYFADITTIGAKKYYGWLMKYYQKKVKIYKSCFNKEEKYIPFIIENEQQKPIDIKTMTEQLMMPGNEHEPTLTKHQDRLIEKRKRAGQRIENKKTLCFSEGPDNNKIYYTECDYYDLAGCMLEYDWETYNAVKWSVTTPLR